MLSCCLCFFLLLPAVLWPKVQQQWNMAPQSLEHTAFTCFSDYYLWIHIFQGEKPSFCPLFEMFSCVVQRECDRETRLNRKLEEVQAQIAVLAPFYCLSSLFVGVGCCALLILYAVLNYTGPFPMLLLGLFVELYIKNCWILNSEASMKLQKV